MEVRKELSQRGGEGSEKKREATLQNRGMVATEGVEGGGGVKNQVKSQERRKKTFTV